MSLKFSNSSLIRILPPVLCLLAGVQVAVGQGILQPGVRLQRTIAAGETHTYSVTLKPDQFLSLLVEPNGIDVGVRVYSPEMVWLFDTDSGDGTTAEKVRLVAESAGNYRFDVVPLDRFKNPPSGRYTVQLVEIRQATEPELMTGKPLGLLRTRGLALLNDVTQLLPEIHNPQTRARYQIEVAGLYWGNDDPRAIQLMEQAIESVRQGIANPGDSRMGNSDDFQVTLDLRKEIIEQLIPHEPEVALAFIRSTHGLTNPNNGKDTVQQDLDMEVSIANQIIGGNPKRSLQIAEDVLKEGFSLALINTVTGLRSKSTDLAATLAHDILARLVSQRVISSPAGAYLASSFIQLVRPAGRPPAAASQSNANSSLISDAEFKSLLQKLVSEIVSYSPSEPSAYTTEKNAAQQLAYALKQMESDVQIVESARAPAVMQKLTQVANSTVSPAPKSEYPANISDLPADKGLAIADQAPAESRDLIVLQVANAAAASGNVDRGRQIIIDNLQYPARQSALNSLQRLLIDSAVSKGKFEEALRYLENYPVYEQRVYLLSRIASQIGPGLKKSTAAVILEQARNMLNPVSRADGIDEMQTLLEIGEAFSNVNSSRGFEILEPLVDQFNDLSLSAMTMNGFPEKYYKDGELIMTNGNALAHTADQLSQTLSKLSWMNFERAKAASDRIRPISVRIQVYLAIADKAIHPVN